MAIYHMHVKYSSAGSGHSAVAAAAYRHGAEMYCRATGENFNYSSKTDVQHCEIIWPKNAPNWFKNLLGAGGTHKQSERLWNDMESEVKRQNGYYFQEFEVALPRELSISIKN